MDHNKSKMFMEDEREKGRFMIDRKTA